MTEERKGRTVSCSATAGSAEIKEERKTTKQLANIFANKIKKNPF